MIGFPSETYDEAYTTIQFTDKIIKKATSDFSNNKWTRGWGIFGLDKYSDVYLNPAHYFISITENESQNDIKIKHLNYFPEKGMTILEAKELEDRFKHNINQELRNKKIFNFHLNSLNLNSEEESFIRICDSSSKENEYSDLPESNTGKITSLEIYHEFMKGAVEKSHPHTVFYKIDTNSVYELKPNKIEADFQTCGEWTLLSLKDYRGINYYAFNVNTGAKILLNEKSHLLLKEIYKENFKTPFILNKKITNLIYRKEVTKVKNIS